MLLAGLALVMVVAAVPAGRAADRYGRLPLMVLGSVLSAAGVLMLIWAQSAGQILLFGGLMGLGSAAFAGANWALTADLVPEGEGGRFFALANFGTAGATAAAGLFGPLVDWGNRSQPELGYTLLFGLATGSYLASLIALRRVARHGRRERLPAGSTILGGMNNRAGAPTDPQP
jgi:MFS family permease